ncbi:MAG: glycosyltransferase family 4 protein [Pseudomonadota bacterium]
MLTPNEDTCSIRTALNGWLDAQAGMNWATGIGGILVESKVRRRVVAINRFYRPDMSATSQLLTDLLETLAQTGWDVTVITSRSAYGGEERHASNEVLDGVTVKRVWSTDFGRRRLVLRAVDYLTFYIFAFFSLLATARRGDVILAKTDPPMISVAAMVAARFKGARLVNWCQDLFPETAEALGLKWAGGFFGRQLRKIRNASLAPADRNVVLHATMQEHLVADGIDPSTIEIIPNWPDRGLIPIDATENPLRKDWGFANETVIGYSGNLGRAHMPEKIAELMSATGEIDQLAWLYIGGGAGLENLKKHLPNEARVEFRPYQPISALSLSLSVADIHLVSLDPACEGLIVPSKFYGILAVDRPVIFLGDPNGAIARDLSETPNGLVLDSTQPETWSLQIERFLSGLQKSSDHSRVRTAKEMTDASIARWEAVLKDVVDLH